MPRYIFDTSTLIDLFNNYYESRFPTLWEYFYELVGNEMIISVREVRNELQSYHSDDRLKDWIKHNKSLFKEPTEKEINLLRDIFEVKHFQANIDKRKILAGGAVADPFLVIKAWATNGCVITEESCKENAAKIPNICNHFDVPWTNLEGFMEMEDWLF